MKPAYKTETVKTKDKDSKSETGVMYRMENITPGDPMNRRRNEYKKGAKAPEQLDLFAILMR